MNQDTSSNNSPAEGNERALPETLAFGLRKGWPVLVALVCLLFGYLVGGWAAGDRPAHEAEPAVEEKGVQKAQTWICSMHPQIRRSGPGRCPICDMQLVPETSGAGADVGPRVLVMSETAKTLAEIETAPVERKFVTAAVQMVGKVDFDETGVRRVIVWVPGRIERMYADYVGVVVKEGGHLFDFYGPDLLTAQEELFAAKAAGSAENLKAARDRLRLWGLMPWQIDEIEARRKTSERLTILSPIAGTVVEKNFFEGDFIKAGSRVYTVADLSRVWLKLDAYESDLIWIKYRQEVEFKVEAYPGEVFRGKIAFIPPTLDQKTRTVKVRVNVDNPRGRLKPGMFVRGVVRAKVAEGGRVMDTDLAGKYVCPMHPEEVRDEPGVCSACKMALVTAESLGYVGRVSELAPLVIPASAPLITGKRAVVYVSLPGRKGAYEGREVVLGSRAGEYYIVNDGLKEGELVVTKGNFKIDSALQIQAKPSMMSPPGGGPAPEARHLDDHTRAAAPSPTSLPAKVFGAPEEFRKQLDDLFAGYIRMHAALAADGLDGAKGAARFFESTLGKVDMTLLKGRAHGAWMKHLGALTSSAQKLARSKDIAPAREAFSSLSQTLISVTKSFGTSGGQALYRYRCTMAFDNQGADWLSREREVRNPYYGAAMLRCGELVETISAGGKHHYEH